MANLKANTYESGSQGTTIDGTNSAGGGDAFDAISIGSGNTLIYDGTNARDTLAGKFTSGGTANGYHGWALTSTTSKTWFRVYFAFSAVPAATWFGPIRVVSGGARCVDTRITTSGTFAFRNAADSTIAGLSETSALSANTVYRIEWSVVPSTTVGEVEWWLWSTDPDGAIGAHDETSSATGAVLAANIDGFRMGSQSTPANANGLSLWTDNVAISQDGQIGPASSAPPWEPQVDAPETLRTVRSILRSR